jgi:hypothetical protein
MDHTMVLGSNLIQRDSHGSEWHTDEDAYYQTHQGIGLARFPRRLGGLMAQMRAARPVVISANMHKALPN